MSHRAIAAALSLEDVSIGERLAAFSLASFAGRDDRAWPAARTAARRAGMSRGAFLAARNRLLERGLISIDGAVGASTVVHLGFAGGAVLDREINAQLFESALTRARGTGGARALLAGMAALADGDGVLTGVGAEELAEIAGLSDRTYRRARTELLESGAIVIQASGGGRGRRNVWRLTLVAERAPRRVRASVLEPGEPRQLPLMAAVKCSPPDVRDRPSQSGPDGGERRVGRLRADSAGENPGRNPVSARGRRRTRTVRVDPAELLAVDEASRALWRKLRARLIDAVGRAAFDVWLSTVEPIAVHADDGALILATVTPEMHVWARGRYRRVFEELSVWATRPVRMASDRDLALHSASRRGARSTTPADELSAPAPAEPNDNQQEAV